MSKLLSLLTALIEIDSSSKQGANQAVGFCRSWMEKEGLKVQSFQNNGYHMLISEIGKGDQTIVWNGHVDVVSGKEGQFHPFEQDGKLYGRGAADMKAGVAAMMCAFAELKDADLPYKVQLQIVSDEEIGGFNCAGFLTDQGYLGDFVICSEPTQLGIGLQAKGILQLDIEIGGQSAHGSRPWEGKNAILLAYEIFQQILQLPFANQSSEFYPSPSINLARIEGGTVYNKVPDYCKVSLDIRFLPGQTKKAIIEQIQFITDGKITIHSFGDPVTTEKNNPWIQALTSTLKEFIVEEQIKIFGQHGSADTRFFSRFQIPAIEFGPSGDDWHGDKEYVVIESVFKYKEILVQFVKTTSLIMES